jgi:hypothetical protein
MKIGTAFMWTVILGIISALFETNGVDSAAIVFATLSGLMFLLTFYLILEST